MKRYLKNKSFLTGAILAFIMLGMLVVSLFWLPYDPEEMYLAPKLSLPSISHLMGTDQFGRDVLSRIMKGIQVSFGIGVVVVVGIYGVGFAGAIGHRNTQAAKGNGIGARVIGTRNVTGIITI